MTTFFIPPDVPRNQGESVLAWAQRRYESQMRYYASIRHDFDWPEWSRLDAAKQGHWIESTLALEEKQQKAG